MVTIILTFRISHVLLLWRSLLLHVALSSCPVSSHVTLWSSLEHFSQGGTRGHKLPSAFTYLGTPWSFLHFLGVVLPDTGLLVDRVSFLRAFWHPEFPTSAWGSLTCDASLLSCRCQGSVFIVSFESFVIKCSHVGHFEFIFSWSLLSFSDVYSCVCHQFGMTNWWQTQTLFLQISSLPLFLFFWASFNVDVSLFDGSFGSTRFSSICIFLFLRLSNSCCPIKFSDFCCCCSNLSLNLSSEIFHFSSSAF